MFSVLLLIFNLLLSNHFYKKTVYFKGTDFELSVYKIRGEKSGPTVMIVGGIQGDEPAGYMAADSYRQMGLKRGNLILVPRADLASIFLNKRQINADMNRRFAKKSIQIQEDKVVSVIKSLLKEADYFINLHEGSGFFRPTYIDKLRNPKRYGQSIIIDTSSFYSKKLAKTINLEAIAKKVIYNLNKSISNGEYSFHLNNHHTMEKHTIHPEQRKSATFYAVYKLGVPSFAIETSKEIKDLQKKIKMHIMAINLFLKEFGLEFSFPYSFLKPVKFEYIIVDINGEYKILKKGDSLLVSKNSSLKIIDISVLNKDEGLTADVLHYGSVNDLNKTFIIKRPTKIIVRSDAKILAGIPIKIGETRDIKDKLALLLMINGKNYLVHNTETLEVLEGSRIFIRGASNIDNKNIIINFVGYADKTYSENDINRSFIVPKQLLERFAVDKNIYEIYIKHNDRRVFRAFIKIIPAKFSYVIFGNNGKKEAFLSGDCIEIVKGDNFNLLDIITDFRLRDIDLEFPCGRVSFDDAKGKDILDLSSCGTIEQGTSVKTIKFYANNKYIGYLKLRNRR